MTKQEMTELFSVMVLAWPTAEMFKGGIRMLGPTIELWTACTTDIDFWMAQQAVIRLCKECKFPPTIAEFREKIDAVDLEISDRVTLEWNVIRNSASFGRTTHDAYNDLHPQSLARRAIDAIGGPLALISPMPGGMERWNYEEWKKAFLRLLRQESPLAGASRPAIGNSKQIGGNPK